MQTIAFGMDKQWYPDHFSSGLFVFLLLSCMSCLYILKIRPLLHHLQRLSPILWVVFFFLIVSFAVQKLLNLIISHGFIFVFIVIILGDGSNKMLLLFRSNFKSFPDKEKFVNHQTDPNDKKLKYNDSGTQNFFMVKYIMCKLKKRQQPIYLYLLYLR